MKLQLSFEFMAYLALAFVSIAIIVATQAGWQNAIQEFRGEYSMYMLAQQINAALLSGNANSYAALSYTQMCNQTFNGGLMETKYGNFSIIGDINVQSVCR